MEAIRLFTLLDRNQRNTFVACFLGWALDAFDFFLLTFVIVPMAHDFGTSIADLSYAITLTLAMRPVGAFIFGLLGDRFGRRIPLMIDIIFYSLMELLTAFSPNYTWLLIFRALYGVGMGGEWGLGASLAMETLPTEARGLFSGILQQGYAFGYLLAAIAYWVVFPFFGWRGLFVAGALPAFLVLYIRARVPESPIWLRQQHAMADFWSDVLIVIKRHWALFLYVILLMTAFNAMSHGTQDMYQTFLGEQRHYGVTAKSGDRDHLCFRRYLRWNGGRPSLAKLGAASLDNFDCCAWNHPDSFVGFLARFHPSGDRRVRHAIHGARRLGNRARASQRAFAERGARNFPWVCLSTWKLIRRQHSRCGSSIGQSFS